MILYLHQAGFHRWVVITLTALWRVEGDLGRDDGPVLEQAHRIEEPAEMMHSVNRSRRDLAL